MVRGLITLGLFLSMPLAQPEAQDTSARSVIDRAIGILLSKQAEDGSWGQDAVFGLDVNIRSSITLFCIRALEAWGEGDERVEAALRRARRFVLKHAARRPERPSYQIYDFSFYSAAYALAYFAERGKLEEHREEIGRLLETLRRSQMENGGFSYIWSSRTRDSYEGFATALVVLSLLRARDRGIEIPDGLMDRAIASVEKARVEEGFFGYHIVDGKPRGSYSGNGRLALEGSLVRTVVCEYALVRSGRSRVGRLRTAVENFFKHRDELEKVRKKDHRTHQGKFDNAPYYFLFGHYYVALAVEALDRRTRARAHAALRKILMSIREEDGSWYDSRICGRAYGTAMGLLILSRIRGGEY